MRGRSRASARSGRRGTQITPEVWARKKAMFSGVAASAALTWSPSFSRSSSSTTTTRPRRATASTASCTLENPIRPLPPLEDRHPGVPPTPTCPSTRRQLCQLPDRKRAVGRRHHRKRPARGTARSGRPGRRRGNHGPPGHPPRPTTAAPRGGLARPTPGRARPRARGPGGPGLPREHGPAPPSTAGQVYSTPSPETRTVSSGSSARTVPAPTSTASDSARRRWTSRRASSPVIQRLVPSGAAVRASRLAAILSTTQG